MGSWPRLLGFKGTEQKCHSKQVSSRFLYAQLWEPRAPVLSTTLWRLAQFAGKRAYGCIWTAHMQAPHSSALSFDI